MLHPSADDLWFLPLGGTGEIGMNLNLYGHDGQWLMVDCGVSFDEPLTPAYKDISQESNQSTFKATTHRVVAPNPSFITKQKEALAGIVITHAHEDHVGAIPYLWERFQKPIYTTSFTAEVLRRKLARSKLANRITIIEVDAGDTKQIGSFSVNWLAITHSLPEPFALKINTPVGTVLHTADWKIDANPITGLPFDVSLYKRLGNENILAMVGDSTNATKPGFSISERNCYDGLLSTIAPLKGRVVVGCFGSNIARLISLAKVAKKTKRYMALYGRSLMNMYGIAKQQGIWPDDLPVTDPQHLGYLPPHEVLAVATGSQGEKNTALARFAKDTHPHLSLDKGDTVLFSSIVIPGNEESVGRLSKALQAKGVTVIHSEDSTLPIHASGHPCEEELKLMYHWVKPTIAIPVHGEHQHLQAHANIAKACGIKKTYVGQNGDLYRLAPQPSIRRQVVPVGRIPVQQE
ncbi:ribonuclease J [Alteromonas sp. MmMcT2-2]|uniref:ribonuclease J n=1 Tax=Alteromonas sp. MmMcT2-2 TaxID=2917732 RepID=UPI001EF226C4|nr:ribonuclease J [Alteromonas sp. MmMcT2-2]MCG7642195.1 ribonuclease J [Alteromonas sp. MmMcT2-2]